jgi:alpha-amylase/alpha-mannosidase (GH57 family)
MSGDARLHVVLGWHMHQPQYRDLLSGGYQLPWTYLHALKDYTDMAAHLEAVPAARAVVNFAPLLLEQIADYSRQVEGFRHNSVAIRDPLLAALAAPALPVEREARRALIGACRRANASRQIERFRPYRRLAAMAAWLDEHPEAAAYLSDQFLADLLVWYHLAWLGETVRRTDARVKRLMDKQAQYSLHDRCELLALIGELLAGLIPRYARLSARGQVELSVTPYAHPILPLLLDFEAAREALAQAELPAAGRYPGGEERARWHIREGIATFERHFGHRPGGCWPSEGAVSAPALRLLAEAGFAWTASGQGVLAHSLARAGHAPHALRPAWLYRPYSIADAGLPCFFRDDELSDLIGFTYADWHADDAVANLVHRLESCADACRGHPDRVVPIILDGENAWEHYPENAYYFLSALYRQLSEHPRLALTTFAEHLERHSSKRLATLVAGSWVYGDLSTWIGERDKNRGWDLLVEAKRAFDAARPRLDGESLAAAERQLAVCEGSDWFWWFGDYNPAATVSDFERLFRLHLANLYQLLGAEPPAELSRAMAYGHGVPRHGGTMRPGTQG